VGGGLRVGGGGWVWGVGGDVNGGEAEVEGPLDAAQGRDAVEEEKPEARGDAAVKTVVAAVVAAAVVAAVLVNAAEPDRVGVQHDQSNHKNIHHSKNDSKEIVCY